MQTDDLALRGEDCFHQKPACPCGLGGNFPTAQTPLGEGELSSRPQPLVARSPPASCPALAPAGALAPPPPFCILLSPLAALCTLDSQWTDPGSGAGFLPAGTLGRRGAGAGTDILGSERREGKTGAKGEVPRTGSAAPIVGRTSTDGKGWGWGREGGSETGSGFFKGVGGESGTRVMSPPGGPRPLPSRRTPPPRPVLLHTPLPLRKWPRHGQPPKSPLPWGAGATWAVGNRVAPAGKGIEDTGATREGPLETAVRDFSKVGGLEGGFGWRGRLVLKTYRARRSGGAEGTGYEAGGWTMVWDGSQAWGCSDRGAGGFGRHRSRREGPALSNSLAGGEVRHWAR